jgi:choline dehydrogenase-like flavoprotein
MRPPTIDRAEVVVVGSGAGGGLIAAELGRHGLDVLVLEVGRLVSAESYTRFELRARRDLWWPTRFAETQDGDGPPIALLAGRCVGGTTVINTKVAMRATPGDVEKWHDRTGLRGDGGQPFDTADLAPWYERVEGELGVRERRDWTPSVHRVRAGFRALGADLEPVRSYTDWNCSRCGSCLTGCPTNAGKSALNTYLAPAIGRGQVRLRTETGVARVLIDRAGATPQIDGVEVVDGSGVSVIEAPIVVLAAGSLSTPQILLRSPDYVAIDSASARLVGRTLGMHPSRLVYGLFDEPQDCHRAYPISAHSLEHQADAAGGFVIEATTIQDPVAFAEGLVDDDSRPLWGGALADIVARYRYWAGVLVMATDENTATVELDEHGEGRFRKRFSTAEAARMDAGLAFASDALRAAGASRVVHTGIFSTHAQGTAPMGGDPERSVVDGTGRSHDVAGLYVGDGSLIPASLSVNPSLTIMALAARVAGGLTQAVAA